MIDKIKIKEVYTIQGFAIDTLYKSFRESRIVALDTDGKLWNVEGEKLVEIELPDRNGE